jgi:hypothetical protein
MLIGLSGHSWMFASLAWIMSMHEPVSQKNLRLFRLTKLLLNEEFTAGADRLEVISPVRICTGRKGAIVS